MPNPCQNYALKAPTSLPDVQDLKPSTSIRMPTSGRLGHVDPVGRFPTYPVSNNVNFELVYEAHDRIKLMLILLSWLLIFCSACMLVFSVLPTLDILWLVIVFHMVHISCNMSESHNMENVGNTLVFVRFCCTIFFICTKTGMSRSDSRNSVNQDLNSPRSGGGGGGLSLASMGTGRHSAARAQTPSRRGSSVYIGGDDSGVFLLLIFSFLVEN